MFRGTDTPEDVQRVAELDAGTIDYLGVDFFSEVFLGLYHDAHGNEVTMSGRALVLFGWILSVFYVGCLCVHTLLFLLVIINQHYWRWSTVWPNPHSSLIFLLPPRFPFCCAHLCPIPLPTVSSSKRRRTPWRHAATSTPTRTICGTTHPGYMPRLEGGQYQSSKTQQPHCWLHDSLLVLVVLRSTRSSPCSHQDRARTASLVTCMVVLF